MSLGDGMGAVHDGEMKTLMKLEELITIAQLTDFLSGTQAVAFSVLGSKDECYRFLQTGLARWGYVTLPRSDKGIVTRYLMKISGYSRQQLTRLIARYRDTGRLQRQQRTVAGFRKKYSDVDIRLLAVMDERHETPCGHTLKKLCERACKMHGDTKYQVLAGISVSHLYNLRKSTTYQRQRRHFEKTRSRVSTIGERRKPDPDGQPGFLRIDAVHQGDQDKQKGVYHINAVDEVTQFEAVCSVEKISELYLIPALEAMFETFPFVILGFHSDNGSEHVNHRVAALLTKLNIEFTKSRSRQTNDNALAESKNASVPTRASASPTKSSNQCPAPRPSSNLASSSSSWMQSPSQSPIIPPPAAYKGRGQHSFSPSTLPGNPGLEGNTQQTPSGSFQDWKILGHRRYSFSA
jgi:transposase InsO family protein